MTIVNVTITFTNSNIPTINYVAISNITIPKVSRAEDTTRASSNLVPLLGVPEFFAPKRWTFSKSMVSDGSPCSADCTARDVQCQTADSRCHSTPCHAARREVDHGAQSLFFSDLATC